MLVSKHSSQTQPSRDAFTLVELSIVLVVIALLVGGVMAGQSLIRSAALRAATTDLGMYKNAVAAFKEKYLFYPGDMPTAWVQWEVAAGSAADGVDATCAALTAQSADKKTCNGDGSGFIADSSTTNQRYEAYRAWQQMGNAGLIKGTFGGVSGTGRTAYNSLPGTNAPIVKLDEMATWTFRSYNTDLTGSSDWFDTPAGNFLALGSTIQGGNANNGLDPVLKPEEAFKLDTKLDDGSPGTGTITALKGNGTINLNCTVDGTATTPYKLTRKAIACAMIARIL